MNKLLIIFIIAFIIIGITVFNEPFEQKDYIYDKFLGNLDPSDPDAGAEYSCKTKNMVIYVNNGYYWWNLDKFNHEWGHNIVCQYFNKSMETEWKQIFKESVDLRFRNSSEKYEMMINGTPFFRTTYAMESWRESFAESFRFFAKGDKLDSKREQFMEKYIREMI